MGGGTFYKPSSPFLRGINKEKIRNQRLRHPHFPASALLPDISLGNVGICATPYNVVVCPLLTSIRGSKHIPPHVRRRHIPHRHPCSHIYCQRNHISFGTRTTRPTHPCFHIRQCVVHSFFFRRWGYPRITFSPLAILLINRKRKLHKRYAKIQKKSHTHKKNILHSPSQRIKFNQYHNIKDAKYSFFSWISSVYGNFRRPDKNY